MDIEYQLISQSNNRANKEERANHTIINHFMVRLFRVDTDFCLQMCDRLLQHTTISLNLLRQSIIIPRLLSYPNIFEEFDYNRTHLAPPWKRIVIYNRPKSIDSWAPHGEDGWNIGPAM